MAVHGAPAPTADVGGIGVSQVFAAWRAEPNYIVAVAGCALESWRGKGARLIAIEEHWMCLR